MDDRDPVTGFDRFLQGLDYPMFVVTTEHEGQRAGCLVGFVTQASMDPPRMLVCLSVQNHTYDVACHAAVLALHVLDERQRDLAELFGSTTGDEIDKFTRCRWEEGPHGVPLLSECQGWMVGLILERIPLGDHVGFLLEPVANRRDHPGPVLTFQQVQNLSPGHPA